MVRSCHANYHRRGRTARDPEAAPRAVGLRAGDGARTRRGGRPTRGCRALEGAGGAGPAWRALCRRGAGPPHERAGAVADRAGPALTADTCAVVAALSAWHEHHEPAAEALEDVSVLPAHVVLESYSVLTRLPRVSRALAHPPDHSRG